MERESMIERAKQRILEEAPQQPGLPESFRPGR